MAMVFIRKLKISQARIRYFILSPPLGVFGGFLSLSFAMLRRAF